MSPARLSAICPVTSILPLVSGCAKPKKAFEEPKVREEAANPSPSLEDPRVSDEELRRQRLMQEAAAVLKTIYFPLDQSTLDAKARGDLAGIHRFLISNPEVYITVAGHCDERGTDKYNLALGEKRAKAISAYLTSLGVPETRVRTISYGEERPAAEGQAEDAWKLNRRAEFTPEYRF